MAQDDVLRRLRSAGLRPGSPAPEEPAGLGLDITERKLIDRITNANDAQVAIARQQIAMNARQFTANERNGEVAQAQWLLVYAADIYKFNVGAREKGQAVDENIDAAVRAHILRAFTDDEPAHGDSRTSQSGVTTEKIHVAYNVGVAEGAAQERGHEQVYEGGGFVEHGE